MSKKDFSSLLIQSQSQKRATNLESENQRLREKLQTIELIPSSSALEKIKLSEIKLTSNIRDNYEYEQIQELAKDIAKHGQLQPLLLTSDNYLLAGYRRFHALKSMQEEKKQVAIVYKTDFTLESLSTEQLDEMQYAENNERRSLDNFQISKLFNKYLEIGYDQKKIGEKFDKSKTFVSAVISFKNIDSFLIDLMKQFQLFAWSKEKFTLLSEKELKKQDLMFYDKNKGIIGWKILYDIAKQKNLSEQKKVFIKYFKNRLSVNELNSDFFKDISISGKNSKDISNLKNKFKTFVSNLKELNTNDDKTNNTLQKINEKVQEIENLLKNI